MRVLFLEGVPIMIYFHKNNRPQKCLNVRIPTSWQRAGEYKNRRRKIRTELSLFLVHAFITFMRSTTYFTTAWDLVLVGVTKLLEMPTISYSHKFLYQPLLLSFDRHDTFSLPRWSPGFGLCSVSSVAFLPQCSQGMSVATQATINVAAGLSPWYTSSHV